MPKLTPVLRLKDKPKPPSSTPPTGERVIKTVQGALPPVVRIILPDPEAEEAKVTGR